MSRPRFFMGMRILALLTFAAATMAPSCAGRVTSPAALAGQWSHVRGDNEPPGFFRQFTLTVADTTLTGSGTWQGEAGPSGPLDVTGVVSGGAVHLDFVFHTTSPSPGQSFTGHFDGQPTSPNDLVGTLTMGTSPAAPEHFARPSS